MSKPKPIETRLAIALAQFDGKIVTPKLMRQIVETIVHILDDYAGEYNDQD